MATQSMNRALFLALLAVPFVFAEDPTIFDKSIHLPAVTSHYAEPTPTPDLPPIGAANTEITGIPAPSESSSVPVEVLPDSEEVINKIIEIRKEMEGLEDMIEPTIQKLASIPRHRLLTKMLA